MKRKLLTFSVLVGFFIVLGVVLEVGLFIRSQINSLPNEMSLMKEVASNQGDGFATEIYDRHGVKIGEISDKRQYYVSLDQVPKHVKDAFIAIEDRDFYHHSGFDISAIIRAGLKNIENKKAVQGASTITQQLARMLFLSKEKTLHRKIKEITLAMTLERYLSKDEILELYLNKIFLGNRSYGLEAASRNYFNKPTEDLSVGEAAMLAGLPKAPSRLAPHRHYERAKRRQILVLGLMRDSGFLNAEEYFLWKKQDLKIQKSIRPKNLAPYFVQEVHNHLRNRFEMEDVTRKGYKVYTTLDYKVQKQLQNSMSLIPGHRISRSPNQFGLQAAGVSLDLKTGGVVAMQGGTSYGDSQFNRIKHMRRQMGLMVIPIIALAAIEQGYTLGTPVDAEHNVSLLQADASSPFPSVLQMLLEKNLQASVILLAAMGVEGPVKYMEKAGFIPRITDLKLGLGLQEVSPMELGVLMGALTNSGMKVSPYIIDKILSRDGKVLYEKQLTVDAPVFEKKTTSEIMNFALSVAFKENFPQIAEKGIKGFTSIDEEFKNSWVLGYNKNLLHLQWIGAERGQKPIGNTVVEVDRLAQGVFSNFAKVFSYDGWRFTDTIVPSGRISFLPFQYLDRTGKESRELVPYVIGTGPSSRTSL